MKEHFTISIPASFNYSYYISITIILIISIGIKHYQRI